MWLIRRVPILLSLNVGGLQAPGVGVRPLQKPRDACGPDGKSSPRAVFQDSATTQSFYQNSWRRQFETCVSGVLATGQVLSRNCESAFLSPALAQYSGFLC